MERITAIEKDGNGNVVEISTDNYRFIFPEEKRPSEYTQLQKGDVFQFNCQGEGGTPLHPLVTIRKPGLRNPIYSEIVPAECIRPTAQ